MVTLGTGVGGGIIVGGKMISGAHGYGGEIGHMCINTHETEYCNCGKRGCLEQYASERAILHQYAARMNLDRADIDSFVAACNRQEPTALSLLDEFVRYMAVGINNLLNIIIMCKCLFLLQKFSTFFLFLFT